MADAPHASRSFNTTCWTLVVAASGDSPQARDALAVLCRQYYSPLYAYARTQCHSDEDARDAVQSFFELLMERRLWEKADRDRGRMRTFLLSCFKNMLLTQSARKYAAKREGKFIHVPLGELSPTDQNQLAISEREQPEAVYTRRWALSLVGLAVDDVRQEWMERGKGGLFESLHGYVTGEGSEGPSEMLAQQLGLTAANVRTAASRLRREFKEAVIRRIADTLHQPDAATIQEELKALTEGFSGTFLNS